MRHCFAGFVAGAVVATIFSGRCRRGEAEAPTTAADTVRVIDTLTVVRPVERWRTVVKTVERSLALSSDSTDTVSVAVPLEKRLYVGDDYRAVVSGYEARLDTLQLRRELQRVMLPKPASVKRWGVSVTAGVALTPVGVQPMVGVGVSYRLVSF